MGQESFDLAEQLALRVAGRRRGGELGEAFGEVRLTFAREAGADRRATLEWRFGGGEIEEASEEARLARLLEAAARGGFAAAGAAEAEADPLAYWVEEGEGEGFAGFWAGATVEAEGVSGERGGWGEADRRAAREALERLRDVAREFGEREGLACEARISSLEEGLARTHPELGMEDDEEMAREALGELRRARERAGLGSAAGAGSAARRGRGL